jgi:ribosome biogenesis SPOUT family RNA methylase Rps3
MTSSNPTPKTFIVEHLDPELEEWSSLEYASIATESQSAGCKFFLTSVAPELVLPQRLQNLPGLNVEHRSVEEIYKNEKGRVCLLDPAAKKELAPEDGGLFDVFLFGGILG